MQGGTGKNTYLLIIESKKQTKQTRRTEIESWIHRECFDGCQMGGGCQGMGEEVRGLSTNRWLQNSHGDVKYHRKWSSQRTYLYDPWT